MSEPLTDSDIVILNAARAICDRLAEGFPDDYGAARVSVIADSTSEAIFKLLNNASTWGKANLTHEQLHRRPGTSVADEPAATPEPQSLRA